MLEGLADSIAEIADAVPRDAINDDSYRLLADPSAVHATSLHGVQCGSQKIRLREPLPLLVVPDIYNPVKVLLTALDQLVQLRRAPSLRQLALDENGGLPLPEQLTQVSPSSAKSVEDMDGVDRKA